MHLRLKLRVASRSWRAPLLLPWPSRSGCRGRPAPTASHCQRCPPTFRCHQGPRRSSWVTLSANPTTPPGTKCPDSGFAFTLFTPQATLFGDNEKQVITHYFSPNPSEGGTIRATWQDSHDTSTVWAFATATATHATDPTFVQAGAVAWLKLQVVGAQSGPIGSNKLTPTTFIQRINTSGGVAPSTGCASSADVGREAFVPYTADYFFYTGGESDADGGN
jgi:hypothetical protein